MKNHIEITNFNDPNLDLYARLSEVQLLRYAEPKQGIFVAESPKVIGRALQAGYEPISFLLAHQDLDRDIGRAPCRDRVYISLVAQSLKNLL